MRKIIILPILCLSISVQVYAGSDVNGGKECSNNNWGYGSFRSIGKISSFLSAIGDAIISMNDDCKLVVFRQTYDYYLEMLDQANDRYIKYGEEGVNVDIETSLDEALSKIGWEFTENEGLSYIQQTSGFFISLYGDKLPNVWRDYFLIRDLELIEGFENDGVLLISWEQLAQRIHLWENFVIIHPGFYLNDEIQNELVLYVRIFLMGLNNTPIGINDSYDRKKDKMRMEIRDSIKKFISENKESRFHDLMNGYYKILNDNDFKLVDEAFDYLSKHGLIQVR